MHPRFYDYYEQELLHLRERAAEFGREHPKVAGRLHFDKSGETADPYVERLLEGFAFLAARVHLRFDGQFPQLTQHLMQMLYPDFLAPTPSMAIVQIEPDMSDPALASGATVPRGSRLRARLGPHDQTACEFRTAHEVTLWPVKVATARYVAAPPPMSLPPHLGAVASSLAVTLKAQGEAGFAALPIDELTFHFAGQEGPANQLADLVLSSCVGIMVTPGAAGKSNGVLLPASALTAAGLSDDEALLPVPQRQFRGYRLLREYAAFPDRFLFARIAGLRAALAACAGHEATLTLLFRRADARLESSTSPASLLLHATPVINLFEKTADRMEIRAGEPEIHLLADRARPLDYEIYAPLKIAGHGADLPEEIVLRPLFAAVNTAPAAGTAGNAPVYYTLRREPRLPGIGQRRPGTHRPHIGSECYLAITDTAAPPYRDGLQLLSMDALCTNRDLPLWMPVGDPRGDFSLDASAPVQTVRCLRKPSAPVAPHLDGDLAWQAISHLSLNYLSLLDTDPQQGAAALRQMLRLYGAEEGSSLARQLDGVRSAAVTPIVRRLPGGGPATFGRGQEVHLVIDERGFGAVSPTIFGGVLAEFLRRHVTINGFAETVLSTVEGREIKRWAAMPGLRPVI